ncbi:MAG TPA: hypothetical protein VK473_02580 [Terriglobales bacterium]|nr:hypothetical protein [Terriglobales bacterium]
MKRREFLERSAALGMLAAMPSSPFVELVNASSDGTQRSASPLKPPAQGSIPVAFLISEGAVVIDFCGPWEVFQDVARPGMEHPFRLYTVAESTKPIRASAGLMIVPDYTLQTAPAP